MLVWYRVPLSRLQSKDRKLWEWCRELLIKIATYADSPGIFSCDQAAIWLVQSVRPSVCLSVCPSVRHTFFTMFPSSYHREIFRSYYHSQKWCPCKSSRSEVKGQGHRGQHPTPVWIHIWQWNHAHSWKQHRIGALLFFKVIRQISRSHGSKKRRIWPRLGVSGR